MRDVIKIRCEWSDTDPLYREYHDKEWGVPTFDDRLLFEYLILEGMQAGLSWSTILRKRENFRQAFDNFEYRVIARYDKSKINTLLQDPGIIRNRLKIEAAIQNAITFINVQQEFGRFSQG